MTCVDVKNGKGMSFNETWLTFWFLPPFAQPVSSSFHFLPSLPTADSDQTVETNEGEEKKTTTNVKMISFYCNKNTIFF